MKAMEVKLIMASGKGTGQEVPVTGPRFFIGRAEDCQLRPRSDLISRHHCVILIEPGFVVVRDFGSKNGTFVNGERVVSEAELRSGDILKVGPLEFQVRIESETPTQDAGVPTKTVAVAAKPGDAATPKKPKIRSVQEAAARTVESSATSAEDDDVSAWLDAEVGDSMTETGTMEPTKAAKSPPPKQERQVPALADDEFEAEEPEEPRAKPKTQAFQIPTKPKGPATSSSKDSAANALKNFFNRR
jgi:predicted component of type VI protein secretion system